MELIMDYWSKEEDKAFENALANYPQNWEQVVANLTGKSLEEINRHYVNLIDDVNRIESGIVPLPDYDEAYRSAKKCRRGTTWSDDEHRLFLEGVDKHGWGDWRSISRNCVVTRTPTQVASHAQKYNLRLSSKGEKKARRRSSILDITRVKNGDNSAPKGPITGQAIDSAATPSGIYAAPRIEQPIGGPPVSAVGTRVNLTFSELMAYDGLGPDY